MPSDQPNAQDPQSPMPGVYTATTSPAPNGSVAPTNPSVGSSSLYPQSSASPGQASPDGSTTNGESGGAGTEGEVDVWKARYSMKNFLGRGLALAILTGLWIFVAIYNRDQARDRMSLFTLSFGAVTLLLWLALGFKMLVARYSLYYRMTTRRLFYSSGLLHRRRDQLELLRVKDVFTRQSSLLERMLGLGTVAVVANDKELPTFYFNGVSDPKKVMDLIWHHTRAEHDHRSVKVEQA